MLNLWYNGHRNLNSDFGVATKIKRYFFINNIYVGIFFHQDLKSFLI